MPSCEGFQSVARGAPARRARTLDGTSGPPAPGLRRGNPRIARFADAHAIGLRLMADQAVEVLAGVSHALIVLGLLVDDPARPPLLRGGIRLRVPDLLPPSINAIRAFVTIGVVELIWIVTAWPERAPGKPSPSPRSLVSHIRANSRAGIRHREELPDRHHCYRCPPRRSL